MGGCELATSSYTNSLQNRKSLQEILMRKLFPTLMLLICLSSQAQQEYDVPEIAEMVILGASEQDNIGIQLDGVGDFNGDGIDDFVLGTENLAGGPDAGRQFAYLIYGSTTFPQTLDLLNDRQGITKVTNFLGRVRVSRLGDFNGMVTMIFFLVIQKGVPIQFFMQVNPLFYSVHLNCLMR